MLERIAVSAGNSLSTEPLYLYSQQNGILENASSTSIFVMANESRALIIVAYRAAGPSNQPQRRGRPVVEPNSLPRVRTVSPGSPRASAGHGPPPTRVVYALETPMIVWTCFGEMPSPVATPPAAALDDVTNGNVPWSISSMVACAPSKRIDLPSAIARLSSEAVSATY